MVPHVINSDCKTSLNKDMKIYMDDVLYKGSAYDRGVSVPIKEFCSISNKVILGFRNKPKILVSKRGHYKLSRERYEEVLRVMMPDYHADFDTGRIVVEGQELVEPRDIREFVKMLQEGYLLFGTDFINDLVMDGQMLKLEGSCLSVNGVFDCFCCGDLSEGYLKHLLDIKEMNGYTYLTIHNYNILNDIMNGVRDDRIQIKDIRI